MQTNQIPVITVSYNSPDLIEALLRTFRQFYSNKVYVIDGSRPEVATQIGAIAARFPDVEFIPFGYNIHHGPGMTWAVHNLNLQGQALFLDSDVEIVKDGFLETLQAELEPGMWGVGSTQRVNERGYDEPDDGPIHYLHPACMLVNLDVMRQWPLPIKHGAPNIQTMLALNHSGNAHLYKHVQWVREDFEGRTTPHFIKHPWQGTVKRTGGYHYDMPAPDGSVDPYLLHFVPTDAAKVIDVGCGNGLFAKAYRARHPICQYLGVELDPQLADQARPHCDFVFNMDITKPTRQFDTYAAGADCWILGDVLTSLPDPWALLSDIRRRSAPGTRVVVSVRNAQHWSVQARLAVGDLHYRDDTPVRPHDLRLFTRATLLDLLRQTGFELATGSPEVRDEPAREQWLPAIRALAAAGGNDPEQAAQDALAWQYVCVATLV